VAAWWLMPNSNQSADVPPVSALVQQGFVLVGAVLDDLLYFPLVRPIASRSESSGATSMA
jgi:hypothetical protein